MAAIILVVVPLFVVMTIDQRIRTHIFVESVVQVLLSIGVTALGTTAFLPMNRRESAGPIEKYFRISLVIQSVGYILDTMFIDSGIIYQTTITYVVSGKSPSRFGTGKTNQGSYRFPLYAYYW